MADDDFSRRGCSRRSGAARNDRGATGRAGRRDPGGGFPVDHGKEAAQAGIRGQQ